jgi:peptidoglycan hydrolase-like protein with peptidoglycan-binding domain
MATLRIGTTDHTSTLALQRALVAAGHTPGPVDGLYGLRTAAAVAGYQSAHPPLVVDGVAGPATLGALGLAGAPAPESAPSTLPTGAAPAPYLTPIDALAPPLWARVGPSLWLTAEPLRDASTGLYARLSYRSALSAAASMGATLARPSDVELLHALAAVGRAVEVAPVTLPTVAMVRASGFEGPVPSAAYEAAAQRLRVASMRSIAWCRVHDASVAARATARGWSAPAPLSGAGKHWVSGAPAGRAYLFGWWEGGRWIQPRPAAGSRGPHDDGHTDYATTTMLRTSTPPAGWTPAPGDDEEATPFPSPNFYPGRPDGPARVLALHSTQNACAPGVARNVAYAFSLAGGVAAHYVAGPDALFQSLADGDRGKHLGSPGNSFTIGIEQTGYAEYTAAEWDTANARAMLDRVVRLLARLCRRHSIPAVVLTPGDVAAGAWGIATHDAIGDGVGGTSHWDPGPHYPLASVVQRVAALL